MAEQYMPFPANDYETVVQLPAVHGESESARVIYIDEYRERFRRDVLKKISHHVLMSYTTERTLSIVPISIGHRLDGSMCAHYAEYRGGRPDDHYGVVHLGWSGGPETKRIVVAQYEYDSGSIRAGLLLPRNLRYLESDLRAKRHTPEYDSMIQEATVQLKVAEDEIKLASYPIFPQEWSRIGTWCWLLELDVGQARDNNNFPRVECEKAGYDY